MCAPSAAPCPESSELSFEAVMGSRRVWRRLAKRAAAAYERDVAGLARRIAQATPPVGFATSRPLRGTGEGAVVVLTLSLPGWELELSGIAAGAAEAAEELTASTVGIACLTRTGRYGSFWWIELSGDREPLVLLGSKLRLWATGAGGGSGGALTPPLVMAGSGS
jgi:hypothetical protein